MKYKRTGKAYWFSNGEYSPEKVSKQLADTSLARLTDALRRLQDVVKTVAEKNPEFFFLLNEEVFHDEWDFDHKCSPLADDLLDNLSRLREEMSKGNAEFGKKTVFLEDLGFRAVSWGNINIYEKVLEDSDEKEVVEELQWFNNTLHRRIRTTYWEHEPGCKRSVKIKYKKLPIGKKLLKAYEETKKMKTAP